MRTITAIILTLTLAACGADGEPIKPTAKTNVNLSSNGIGVGTNLGLRKGPFAVNVGLGL